MNRTFIFIAALCLLLAAVLTAGAVETETKENPYPDMVATKCDKCHSVSWVCRNLGVKDKDAWVKTVQAMRDKGMQMSDQDAEAVADYLARLEPGSSPVCD